MQHNDLGPWNIISEGGSEFIAVDWESANPSGLPLWDLWYFLAHALRLLDGEDAADDTAFSRLFRGGAPSSPELFRWTRTAVEALEIPPDAVGRLATLCWLHHGLSREARSAALDRVAEGGETLTPAAQRLPTRLAFRSGARERLAKLDGRRTRLVRPVLAPPPVGNVVGGATPAFSAVIAAYDTADTIPDAVESLLTQTVKATEIVVCDDGSQDDLAAALAPFRDRIMLVRQDHGGEGAAKNNGAFHARRGDFIVFLDADDTFLPERLEALGELAAARPDLDILTTDAFLEVDGEVVRRCYEAGWTFEVHDQRAAILERNFVFGHAAVRRTRFLESGGFDPSISHGTDWDLWCRMLLDGSRVGLVNEPLARYRLRRNSLSANRAALLEGRCRVLERAASRDGSHA